MGPGVFLAFDLFFLKIDHDEKPTAGVRCVEIPQFWKTTCLPKKNAKNDGIH